MPLQVFVSHLHSDHIADLASLYIGAMFGRRCASLPEALICQDRQFDELRITLCLAVMALLFPGRTHDWARRAPASPSPAGTGSVGRCSMPWQYSHDLQHSCGMLPAVV